MHIKSQEIERFVPLLFKGEDFEIDVFPKILSYYLLTKSDEDGKILTPKEPLRVEN